MSKYNTKKSFLPQCDGYALDFIKLSAALFMIVDHVNTLWLHQSVLPMALIGRGTFPLFCYAIAAGVLRTKDNAKKYMMRLIVLAVISQPFYYFAFGGETLNVIFTLAFGAFFAVLALRVAAWQMYMLYVAALVSMLWVLPLQFGLAGVMLPSAIILVHRGQKNAWPFLILLLLFINAGGLLEGVHNAAAWTMMALNGLASIALPWLVLDAARYMKQTGRFLPKYALHVFYPGHLAALKLLGMAFFK
jgi:hypothetical protein